MKALAISATDTSAVVLDQDLARALGVPWGELAILRYVAERQGTPDAWVDVDRREVAQMFGTSAANVRRALVRLRHLRVVEQKRPRSTLWRIRPDILRYITERG